MTTVKIDLRRTGYQTLGSDSRCGVPIYHDAVGMIHLQFNHTPSGNKVVQKADGKNYETDVIRYGKIHTLAQDQEDELHKNDTFVFRRLSDGSTTYVNVEEILDPGMGRGTPDAIISSNPPDAPPVSVVGQTAIASPSGPPSLEVHSTPQRDADDAILVAERAKIAAKSQRGARKSNGATRMTGGFLRMIHEAFTGRTGRSHPDAERAQQRDEHADEGMPLPSKPPSQQRTRNNGARTMATDPNQTPGQLPTAATPTPAPRQLTAGQAAADDKPATAQTAATGQAPASEKKPEPEKKGWERFKHEWSQRWNWVVALLFAILSMLGLICYKIGSNTAASIAAAMVSASASASHANAAAPPAPAPTSTVAPWGEYVPTPAEQDAAPPSEVGDALIVVIVDASETSVTDASDSATDADAADVSDAPAAETKPAFTSCVPMTLENAKAHLGSMQTSIEHLQTKVEGVDGVLNCKDASPAAYWQPDDTLYAAGCTICPPAASSDAKGKK